MSTDDRFEEIKHLLDSTINEFQTLFESAGGFEDSRVGNGWAPEKLTPEIYFLQPKPLPELLKTAEGRKASLFKNRVLSLLKPKDQDVHTAETPKLKLIPFWRIRGYHECFYFRGNTYKIDLPPDVVAVEVEGKIRDLVELGSAEGQGISNLAKRLLGRREGSESKSFRLSEITELAHMYDENSLFLNAQGKGRSRGRSVLRPSPTAEENHLRGTSLTIPWSGIRLKFDDQRGIGAETSCHGREAPHRVLKDT